MSSTRYDPVIVLSPDLADRSRSRPIWQSILITFAAILLLVGWDSALAISARLGWLPLPHGEEWLYLVIKSGFGIALCLLLSLLGAWRTYGFTTLPLGWQGWWMLLPAWAGTVASLLHGMPAQPAAQICGWLALGIAIAFGEETIFRGIILNALTPHGRRRAVVISGGLFGSAHLIGLIAGMDWRMVLAQAVFAGGLGLTFGWARIASASIWPCIIAHALLDMAGLTAAGGISQALEYDPQAFYSVVIMAAGSLAWGIYLVWKRLPLEQIQQFEAVTSGPGEVF